MSQLLGPFSVHRFGRQRNLPATSRRNEERKSFLRLSSNRMLQGKVLSWYRSSSTSDWDAISQWKWTRSQREAIVIDLKLSSSQRDKVKNFSEFQRVRMRCEIEWVATLFSNLQTATLRPAPTDWLTLTGGAGEQEEADTCRTFRTFQLVFFGLWRIVLLKPTPRPWIGSADANQWNLNEFNYIHRNATRCLLDLRRCPRCCCRLDHFHFNNSPLRPWNCAEVIDRHDGGQSQRRPGKQGT